MSDSNEVEAAARRAATAILRAHRRADGKHPRSHTNHEYLSLVKRLGPIVAHRYLSLLSAQAAREAEVIERCAAIVDGWLEQHGDREIVHVPARKYASDAVKDIRDAIRALTQEPDNG